MPVVVALPQFDVGDVVSFKVPLCVKNGRLVGRRAQGPIIQAVDGWLWIDVAGEEVVVPVEDCVLVT